jgi:hypothetical protein
MELKAKIKRENLIYYITAALLGKRPLTFAEANGKKHHVIFDSKDLCLASAIGAYSNDPKDGYVNRLFSFFDEKGLATTISIFKTGSEIEVNDENGTINIKKVGK